MKKYSDIHFYEKNDYPCNDWRNVLNKEIEKFDYEKLFEILLPHLMKKHKSNLENLGLSLDMTLMEIHEYFYKIVVFDTIEEIKKVFKDNFIIFTDFFYKKCNFDKYSEKYYYENVICEFLNNEKIKEMIQDVVFYVIRKSKLEGIELNTWYSLEKYLDYDKYKNSNEPLVSVSISVRNAYNFIKKNYLETGEISYTMLDLLSEVVSILSHEDTENIIYELKRDYDEYKIYFSDWFSFSNLINGTHYDIKSLIKIIKYGTNKNSYKEVLYFIKDEQFFINILKKVVNNNETMKILNDVYINTMKMVLEKHRNIKLEVIEKSKEFELLFTIR